MLILTARDEWREKFSDFDARADDDITRPFRPEVGTSPSPRADRPLNLERHSKT